MERKYYLRGLGLGIAVTAVIMGIATSRGKTMTDSEIIARAKELGMVENTVLSKMQEEETQEPPPADDVEEEQEPDNSRVEEDGQPDAGAAEDATVSSETVQGEEEKTEDTRQAEAAEERQDEETDPAEENDGRQEEEARDIITSAAVKTITVKSGDGSHTVAKKLADVGVVTSADDFDAFLCQYGYDKKLRTGTFSIPADASDEQIARIVTGME